MHAGTDLRLMKCFDGLQHSFEILDFVYSELYPACCRINKDDTALAEALWKCWSVIDVVHRIREISMSLPGLGKKNAERQMFLDQTVLVEKYRNYIQHLRSELLNPQIRPFPVWGTLGWVDETNPLTAHMVIIGTQIDGTSYSSCVFDTQKKDWVSKVCLGVDGQSLNIDPIYSACSDYQKFILPWILETFKLPIDKISVPPIMSMTIQLGQKGKI